MNMFLTNLKTRLSAPIKYILLGLFLSLGAPLGYLFILAFTFDGSFVPAVLNELLKQNALALCYMIVSTPIAFGLFGYFLGLQDERLKSKSQLMEDFLNIAAHDIRSPLAVIFNALTVVKDGLVGDVNPKQDHYLGMMVRQTKVIQELLTELLDINRMESGRYELERTKISIVPLVRQVASDMEMLVHAVPCKLSVASSVEESLVLLIDSFRVRQVLRNLIGNAIKHVPAEGNIVVSIQAEQSHVHMTVFNQGPHIPDNMLSRIFNKFEQVKDRTHKMGVGLGLAICQNIMDLHGGKIWAENVPSGGVAFHLLFKR